MDDRQRRRLLDLLFFHYETEGTHLFALLDGSRDSSMYESLRFSGAEYRSLFSDEQSPSLLAASPFLVRLVQGATTSLTVVGDSWGRSRGMFLAARGGLREVRRHLRTLLDVRTADGTKLFFRFYDPRVMRIFLPTCDAAQLRQVFGPIERFDMEGPDGSHLLRFRLVPGQSHEMRLRSWNYPLSELQDADDDRGRSFTSPAYSIQPTS